jgi:hypothetical protein
MITAGGALFLAVNFLLNTEFSHDPPHQLAVDLPALSFQLGTEASVAISRPGDDHLLHFTRCQSLALS